jgi:hypothetical protein
MALDSLSADPIATWPGLLRASEAEKPQPATGRPLPPLHRLRVHDRVVQRIRHFLAIEGFVEIPGTVPALSEQTGPFFLEALVARGMDAVYREAKSRHGSGEGEGHDPAERIEIEKRNLDLDALCDLQERLLKDVALHLSAEEIGGTHVTRLDWMARWEHPRVTYGEAVAILRRHGFALELGDDLEHEAQAALVRYCGNLPVHVTHFPVSTKPFHTKLDRRDPTRVESADYWLPHAGRTFGGLVKESEVAHLRQRLPQQGLEPVIAKYLALLSDAPVPRGGFVLEVARLLQFVMGVGSIEEAVVLPADGAGCGGVG